MGHSIVVFIERYFLYTGEIHGCNYFGTCPSDLYREVVLLKPKGGVSITNVMFNNTYMYVNNNICLLL